MPGKPVAGHTIAWVVGMFVPFFNFSQLYIDVTARSTGSTDPLTGRFVDGFGFRFIDLYKNPLVGGTSYGNLVLAPNTHLMFLILDMLFWSVLAWYLDNIVPNSYGYRRPLLFFLDSGYWGNRPSCRRALQKMAFAVSGRVPASRDDSDVIQERERALNLTKPTALRITNLTKRYTNGMVKQTSKLAVDNLCLASGKGQLVALLGQNGAGKTTTMSMLYGALQPTSGDAFIYGYSVHEDMDEIRHRMGVCPQHDILFDDLTASEHIRLYAGLKGVPLDAVDWLVRERLRDVRLTPAANTCTGAYSGGMKRRLSMIIATIGEPKIIIMDEPTTGMDPVNRRYVWSFIEKFKQGRVILLSTHLMEEAECLGDTVAVMSKGKLVAIGPSIRLKNKFGAGYRVSVACDEKPESSTHLREIVPRIVPAAKLHDETSNTLVYHVPSLTNLTNLIRYFEDNPHGLVHSWGITQTTLEEVFLHLVARSQRHKQT
ncbi:P-loop containing nucleoside triphosphate hydrolase protein [Thamnocephalis sphaerospora]|uniref:P-loop containing nucleoside triphosphate hydrolase protein n=1 Tax=Thamnocephalis sphaerospora TaxID=78915 RepID=A0A4P9XJR5_9FUNG|nr:P-loop containing nucleoside triphosphate hydrolase protein [Thamnocephalis sphaerospora]|eukprot:RKP06014.1 P-loop containing nucleoside triphosphate hydrolase protein [Thamnocephalis sphaerospora]